LLIWTIPKGRDFDLLPPNLDKRVRIKGKKETHPISAGWVSENLAALPAPRRPLTTTQDERRGALPHNVEYAAPEIQSNIPHESVETLLPLL